MRRFSKINLKYCKWFLLLLFICCIHETDFYANNVFSLFHLFPLTYSYFTYSSIIKLIKSFIDSGLTTPEIYRNLNKTVSRARWYAYITWNEISAKTTSGQPRTVRIKQFIVKTKRKVCFNKKRKSANKIAKEEGCSDISY